MLELYCFKEKIVKRFIQCHTFIDSSSLKRGPIGSETSGRKYHYSLCSNPEERISGGSTVLWNTRSYRPNDIMSHPRLLIFSVSPLWEPNLVFYSHIHYLFCLMMLFVGKFNTELQCWWKSLWLNLTCLYGLREGKYACTWKRIANLQGYTGNHEDQEGLYEVGG